MPNALEVPFSARNVPNQTMLILDQMKHTSAAAGQARDTGHGVNSYFPASPARRPVRFSGNLELSRKAQSVGRFQVAALGPLTRVGLPDKMPSA